LKKKFLRNFFKKNIFKKKTHFVASGARRRRLRSVFGTKTFEILAENVIFFGPNVPNVWVRIGIPGHWSTAKNTKKKWSGARSTPFFFGIFCGRECRTLTVTATTFFS
jgi:hypothetical protein